MRNFDCRFESNEVIFFKFCNDIFLVELFGIIFLIFICRFLMDFVEKYVNILVSFGGRGKWKSSFLVEFCIDNNIGLVFFIMFFFNVGNIIDFVKFLLFFEKNVGIIGFIMV